MLKIKLFLKQNQFFHFFLFITGLIFPLVTVFQVLSAKSFIMSAIDIMWIGFYSCAFIFYGYKSKILKTIMILINLLSFSFLAFGFLMGGIFAPLWLLLKVIAPFISIP